MDAVTLDSIVSGSFRSLGEALASYRQRNGLTLQEISKITGVSVGSLSKIENGKAEPGFKTLMRLVQSLDLGAVSKVRPARSGAGTGRKTVTLKGEALVANSDKAVMEIHAFELLNKDMFPMVAQVILHEAPPFDEWTQHEGEEFVYVLSGSIEVYVEHYRPYILQAGESTYYDSGMRHVLISLGKEDAVVLSVSTSRSSDQGQEVPSF